ncbi:precorrin-3B synthase [Devosia sp. XJ19-1]|uniref:Precorrin-3B synthase n=2 Tax=Devosia ureilytica TaxID=2952754 RepID=A0A9Q4AQG7_9HYPH|nr:precorrin-3B synthase [Devosia ureilytica]MCP8887975.1 precorrin-3B synthase [Devosia ureilytica]
MRTGDGLLARIRVVGSVISPDQLSGLAELATEHGNGLVEVTARGNLQVRGLRPETAPPFATAVARLLTVETGLVVDTSPLAGLDPHEIIDPAPLARQLRADAAPFAARLGPKVSVVVDGGGQISLATFKADIRLTALGKDHWAVALGGGKPQQMDTDSALAAAIALLGALAAIGPEARATDLFPVRDARAEPSPAVLARSLADGADRLRLRDGHTIPIALPFGQVHGAILIALMEAAQIDGITNIRLAPDHCLLLDNASPALIRRAAALGFITDPGDPRRRVSACIGNQGCASGHIAARDIAARLAPQLHAHQQLHVSGCAKGCAHPRPAHVTLVGTADGIGLVINGRAGDTPEQFLDEAALAAALVSSQDRR